jgi:hypothetical protein
LGSVQGSLPRDLERVLTGALVASALAALLLCARNGLAPRERPLTFGLVYWLWFAAAYLAAAVAVFLASALVARLVRRPRLRGALLSLAALAFLAGALIPNARALRGLQSLPEPWRFRALVPVALGCAGLGLFAVAFDRRRAQRLLALAALGLTAAALLPPLRAGGAAGEPPRARPSGERFLLIGLDGGDWDLIEPLLARGELPQIAALRARGAWGPLRTIRPTLSPAVWNSIATGRRPEDHGVRDFQYRRLRGVGVPYPELRAVRGVGFGWLQDALRQQRQIAGAPISSVVRRVPAFWNIATSRGSPVAVLNWWATWPAEPVLGQLVSERAYHALVGALPGEGGLAFPASLETELRELALRPQDVDHATALRFLDVAPEEWQREVAMSVNRGALVQELPYFYSAFESTRRFSLRAMEAGRKAYGAPADQLVLFRLVDMVCHSSLVESELVPRTSPDGRPARVEARAPRAVSEAYRAMDAAVGELQAAFGAGNVLVVSDHGWDVEWRGDQPVAHHNRAPDGIFLAAGPAFLPGRVEGLSVYDVMPILMFLKGWPLADDFAGRLPTALFTERLAGPPARIASYGSRDAPSLESAGSAAVDAEIEERLRALGYVE